jgi:hypothetical protein
VARGTSGHDDRRTKHCDRGPRQATPSPRVRLVWLHGHDVPHNSWVQSASPTNWFI